MCACACACARARARARARAGAGAGAGGRGRVRVRVWVWVWAWVWVWVCGSGCVVCVCVFVCVFFSFAPFLCRIPRSPTTRLGVLLVLLLRNFRVPTASMAGMVHQWEKVDLPRSTASGCRRYTLVAPEGILQGRNKT